MSVTIRVTRTIRAAPEKVFDAWLDPDVARQFLFATPTGTMVKAQIDPRVAGRFLFVDRRDGDDVEHFGEYLEIDRPRRLSFSFAVTGYEDQPTTLVITFRAVDGGTEVTLVHEGVLEEYAKQTEGGWGMILEGLERAVG